MRGVLTASFPAASFMVRHDGARIMDTGTLIFFIVGFASIYPASRVAEMRGRSFKVWAWVAVLVGPLALPLIFLLPNLHPEKVSHA